MRADINGRSVEAGRKAVELAPADPYAQFALARAYYAVCNRDLLRSQAERALAINPNDAAMMGILATISAMQVSG